MSCVNGALRKWPLKCRNLKKCTNYFGLLCEAPSNQWTCVWKKCCITVIYSITITKSVRITKSLRIQVLQVEQFFGGPQILCLFLQYYFSIGYLSTVLVFESFVLQRCVFYAFLLKEYMVSKISPIYHQRVITSWYLYRTVVTSIGFTSLTRF